LTADMAAHSFHAGRSSHLGAIGTPVRPVAATPSTSNMGSTETLSARMERVMQNDQEKANLLQVRASQSSLARVG